MATGIHKSLLVPPMVMRRFRPPGATPLEDTSGASTPLQFDEAAQCIAQAVPRCVTAFGPTWKLSISEIAKF
jgi:hypothetical protein